MTDAEIANAITKAVSDAFAHIHAQAAEFERTINDPPAAAPPSKEEEFRRNMDRAIADHIEDKKTNRWGGRDISASPSDIVSGDGPLGGKEV